METMTALFTRAQYNELPEGFPAQLVEGCLVKEPAPTYGHQRFGSRIHQMLVELVGTDLALMAPVDVVVDELNVYQPDLVVLTEPPADCEHEVGIPLLAIEVLSPSTRTRDREIKRHRLLAAGVREVWLVDQRRHEVERWDLDGCTAAGKGESLPSQVLRGFSLSPDELFSPPK